MNDLQCSLVQATQECVVVEHGPDAIVDQIAIAYVRFSRIYEAEQRAHKLPSYVTSDIEELQRNAEKVDPSARQYLGTIVDLARKVGDLHLASAYYGSNAARTMARYESTLNRQIQRNLNLLGLLQSRASEAAEPANPPPFHPFDAPGESEQEAHMPEEPVELAALPAPESPDNDYDPGYSNELAGYDNPGTEAADADPEPEGEAAGRDPCEKMGSFRKKMHQTPSGNVFRPAGRSAEGPPDMHFTCMFCPSPALAPIPESHIRPSVSTCFCR